MGGYLIFLNKYPGSFLFQRENHQFGIWGKSELKNCQFKTLKEPFCCKKELVDFWVII
jgi:hypothetical protein